MQKRQYMLQLKQHLTQLELYFYERQAGRMQADEYIKYLGQLPEGQKQLIIKHDKFNNDLKQFALEQLGKIEREIRESESK